MNKKKRQNIPDVIECNLEKYYQILFQ